MNIDRIIIFTVLKGCLEYMDERYREAILSNNTKDMEEYNTAIQIVELIKDLMDEYIPE